MQLLRLPSISRGLVALVVLALLALPGPLVYAQGGNACNGLGTLVPMSFEEITVSTTAVGFTSSKIQTSTATAVYAYWYVDTNAVRWREDGVDPTASVGIPAAASTYGQTCGALAVRQMRFIRQSADATIRVAYSKGE